MRACRGHFSHHIEIEEVEQVAAGQPAMSISISGSNAIQLLAGASALTFCKNSIQMTISAMGRVHLTMRQLFLHCAALLVISSADIGAEAWGTNSEHFFFLDYEQSADSRRVADAIHKAFPDVRAITGDTERVFVRCTQEREKEVRTRLKQLGLLPAGEADATMQWISFDDDRALDAAMATAPLRPASTPQ